MVATMKTVSDKLTWKKFIDQSIFVRAAISGVVREGVIAACLTAIMILLFLGSWRGTVIIALSIPLSILVGVVELPACALDHAARRENHPPLVAEDLEKRAVHLAQETQADVRLRGDDREVGDGHFALACVVDLDERQ